MTTRRVRVPELTTTRITVTPQLIFVARMGGLRLRAKLLVRLTPRKHVILNKVNRRGARTGEENRDNFGVVSVRLGASVRSSGSQRAGFLGALSNPFPGLVRKLGIHELGLGFRRSE